MRPLDNSDVIPAPSGLEEPGPDGVEGAVDHEVKILASPNEPSQRMAGNHCLAGHVPYRSWCPHCVRGRGKNAGHGKQKGDHEVPLIGVDYAFLGAGYSRLRGPAKEEAHAKAIAEGVAPVIVW